MNKKICVTILVAFLKNELIISKNLHYASFLSNDLQTLLEQKTNKYLVKDKVMNQ